jgi:hypothetical protein
VPIGIPIVIVGTSQEVIVVKRQIGNRLWFDRPLLYTHTNAALYSAARAKVEISYAREMPNGKWTGVATVYGPYPGIAAEYTTNIRADAAGGPWTFTGEGLRFQAWLPGKLRSTENPTKVVGNASSN